MLAKKAENLSTRNRCIAFLVVHLIALSTSTYVAAIEIESILFTGWLCSATGMVASLYAAKLKRFVLVAACLLTAMIALVLFVLECFYLNLGPQDAALPFCIVFILNQLVSTLVILINLNLMAQADGVLPTQITIKTLMVAVISFSVFFAFANQFQKLEHHNWIMNIALGMMGITLVGVAVFVYSHYFNRIKTVKNDLESE